MEDLQHDNLPIAVAGGGSWGTALAHMLASRGHRVEMLVRDSAVAASINTQHENSRYLAGYPLHPEVRAFIDVDRIATARIVVLAVPCQYLRAYLQSIQPFLVPASILVNAAKGLELGTNNTMQQVVDSVLGGSKPVYAILSGPSFSAEVMQNQPTAVVLGCASESIGARLRELFSTAWFRCYSSTDVRGVELGGAMKNVMAIAAGVCDGMGFGHNTRAALITRGLAEMRRLGLAMGAEERTFMGLSGLGDLTLTCTGNLSRNRQVGLRLGQGEDLHAITHSLGMVAEGVKTAEALHQAARDLGVSAPVTEAVCGIVQGVLPVQQAVDLLMARSLKEE